MLNEGGKVILEAGGETQKGDDRYFISEALWHYVEWHKANSPEQVRWNIIKTLTDTIEKIDEGFGPEGTIRTDLQTTDLRQALEQYRDADPEDNDRRERVTEIFTGLNLI